MISNLLRKSVVPTYRTVAMLWVYGVIAAILLYGATVGYFLASGEWVTPFTVSGSDSQVLTITSQLVASQNALGAITIDEAQTREVISFSREQISSLMKLRDSYNRTARDTKRVWESSAKNLSGFDIESQRDIETLQSDVSRNSELRSSIINDMQSNLITKSDAAIALANIDQLQSQTTTAKVNETNLLDTIRQHQMVDFGALAVAGNQAQLDYQLAQLQSAIQIGFTHLAQDALLKNQINLAIDTAKRSPYFAAVNSQTSIQLAVVPYVYHDDVVRPNAVLYDCYLSVVACRIAGKITAVYPNEVLFENPLTHMNARGYIVAISIDEKSLRSKSLSIGRKPFLF